MLRAVNSLGCGCLDRLFACRDRTVFVKRFLITKVSWFCQRGANAMLHIVIASLLGGQSPGGWFNVKHTTRESYSMHCQELECLYIATLTISDKTTRDFVRICYQEYQAATNFYIAFLLIVELAIHIIWGTVLCARHRKREL